MKKQTISIRTKDPARVLAFSGGGGYSGGGGHRRSSFIVVVVRRCRRRRRHSSSSSSSDLSVYDTLKVLTETADKSV